MDPWMATYRRAKSSKPDQSDSPPDQDRVYNRCDLWCGLSRLLSRIYGSFEKPSEKEKGYVLPRADGENGENCHVRRLGRRASSAGILQRPNSDQNWPLVESGKNSQRYIKYTAEDLERLLDELFEGKSMNEPRRFLSDECVEDGAVQREEVRRECGKGVTSSKALCGHMACHFEREKRVSCSHFFQVKKSE
ncbi:unnamed protein product [Brassica oleracea]|uniref:(rape) hypothetical protein n=1 Tax=Brassica napus TaxID=3708 RepID=A0A816RP54_BRANA|nr:unnamed protein product [Brassica napus]